MKTGFILISGVPKEDGEGRLSLTLNKNNYIQAGDVKIYLSDEKHQVRIGLIAPKTTAITRIDRVGPEEIKP